MKILHNQSLKNFNTFGFDQCAEYFVDVDNDITLSESLEYAQRNNLDIFVLGGGSNLVLTNDIKGLVIHCAQESIRYIAQADANACKVVVGAGVQWHALVQDTLQHGLAGLENLSLIPGQVGAAPVQNIGAYGVELKDRIDSVRALHLPSRQWKTFSIEECQFDYRNSYFKQCPNEYVITEVTFLLGNCRKLNTSYGSLAQYLDTHGIDNPSAIDISKAVIAIRQSRLPDPSVLGNAGSFFHNPVVSREHASALLARYPDLVSFNVDDATVKLSAAWMIDTLGFKGVRRGAVGVYDQQALVLVNHVSGSSNGKAMIALAREIQSAVQEHFSVHLNIEPVIV